jgi:hypothetical protein
MDVYQYAVYTRLTLRKGQELRTELHRHRMTTFIIDPEGKRNMKVYKMFVINLASN